MVREPLGWVAAADKLHLDAVGLQSGMVVKPTPIRCIRDRDAEVPRHGCEFSIRRVKSGQFGHPRKILKSSSDGVARQIDSFDAGWRAVKDQLIKTITDTRLPTWIEVPMVFVLNFAAQIQHDLAAHTQLVQKIDRRQPAIDRCIGISAIRYDRDIRIHHAPHHSAASAFMRSSRAFSAA